MIAPPSYQRYPKDIVSSGEIAALSLEEFGALTLLLDHDWIETGLPMNLKILAKFVRISERKMQKLWRNIARFFVEIDARWMNPGLQIEREKQAARRASLSENGKKGGRPPKATALPKDTDGFIPDNQMKSLPSSSSTASSSSSSTAVLTHTVVSDETPADEKEAQNPKPRKPKHDYSVEFEEAWAAYPHPPGDSKVGANAAYSQRRKDGNAHESIMAGVANYRTYCIAKDWIGTNFCKQGAVFFGPGLHFLSDWTFRPTPTNTGRRPTAVEITRANIAAMVGDVP